jgi:hypothetical protein
VNHDFSATIIHQVKIYCEKDSLLAFAYFYFDFNDNKKRTVDNLVRSLIMQLSGRCIGAQTTLAMFYSAHGKGEQQPDRESLNNTLRGILDSFHLHQAYIILDALDECAELDQLLDWIEEISKWELSKLHLLATSRWDQVIEDRLRRRAGGGIALTNAIANRDIAIYIRDKLQKDSRLRVWPTEILEQIEKALMKGANGM